MPASRRAPFVALLTLLQHRFPGLDDPARLVKQGAVLVNGVPAASTRTRAHGRGHPDPESPMPAGDDQARPRPAYLLDPPRWGCRARHGRSGRRLHPGSAGCRGSRVYAIDAGTGQLRGRLRADPA